MTPNIQQLENDPKFRSLPYSSQKKLRAEWLNKYLVNDPRFQELPSELQNKMFMDVVGAAPKFSDPNVQAYVNEQEGYRRQSGINYTPGMKITDVMMSLYNGFSLAKLAARLESFILEKVMPNSVGPFNKAAARLMWDQESQQKYREYYRAQASKDVNDLNTMDALAGVGGAAGFAGEMLSMLAFGGTPAAARGLAAPAIKAVEKNAAKIALKFGSARVGNWVARSALPNVVHSLTASSVYQMAMEGAKAALTESNGKPSFGKVATAAAIGYGTGAIGDLVMFAATAPFVSMARGVGKIFTLKKASKFLKDMGINSGEFKSILKSFANGDHIDRVIIERIKQFAPETAEQLLSYEAHFRTLRNFESLDPNDPALKKLDAFKAGWNANVDANGKWTLKHIYDPTITREFTDGDAVLKFLEEPASNWMSALDKGVQEGLTKSQAKHASSIKALEAATAGAINNSYYIRQKVQAKLGVDDPTMATIQANLLKPKGANKVIIDADVVQAARLYLKRRGVPDWDTIKIGSGTADPGGYDLFVKRPGSIASSADELRYVSDFIEKVDLYASRKLASGRVTPTAAEATEARVAAGAEAPSPVAPTQSASRAPATPQKAPTSKISLEEAFDRWNKNQGTSRKFVPMDPSKKPAGIRSRIWEDYNKGIFYYESNLTADEFIDIVKKNNNVDLLAPSSVQPGDLKLSVSEGRVEANVHLVNEFVDRKLTPQQWDTVKKIARSVDEETFVRDLQNVAKLSETDARKLYAIATAKAPADVAKTMLADPDRVNKVIQGARELKQAKVGYENRPRKGKTGPLRGTRSGVESVYTSGDVSRPSGLLKRAANFERLTPEDMAKLGKLIEKNPKAYTRFYDTSTASKNTFEIYDDLQNMARDRTPPSSEALSRREPSLDMEPPDSRIKAPYEPPKYESETIYRHGPEYGRAPRDAAGPKPVEVVKKVTTPGQEFESFIAAKAKKAGKEFARAYYRLVGYTESWAQYAATKLGVKVGRGPKGQYVLTEAGKPPQTFDSFEGLTRELLIRSNDFHAIHYSLKDQGVTLAARPQQDGSVIYVAKTAAGGPIGEKGPVLDVKVDVAADVTRANVLAESKNLREVLDHPSVNWQPKAGSFIGPELTWVSPKFDEIQYIQNVAVGDYQHVLRHMSSFRKAEIPNRKFIVQGKEGTITFDAPSYSYELEIPGIGFRKSFATRKEALMWMKKGWSAYDVIDRIADMKGYKIEMGNGGWYIWNEKNHFFAKHLAQVRPILEQAPLPEWAPELLGQVPGPTVARPLVEDGMFKPEVFEPFKGTSANPLVHVNHRWRPLDAWLEQAMANGMDPTALSYFKGLELGRRGSHSDQFRVNQMTATIFKDPTKKGALISEESRHRIFNYMDAYDVHKAEVIRQYQELGKPLTEAEIKIADTATEWIDSFFEKFGISREMKVRNYISHIRNMPKNEIQKLFRGTSAEIMHKIGAPRKVAEFFKNARTDDIMILAKDMDAYSVIMKYTAIGHRSLWMGESVGKIKAWADSVAADPNATPVQKASAWRMGAYVDDVMGIHTAGEEQIRQLFLQMGENMGIKNPDIMKNLYSSLYSASYLVNMGWRPWSAVRNLFQIWTTLAPRFGNAATARGLEYVVKHAEEVIEYLKAKGHLLEELPVIGTEMIGNETTMAKLLHKGLGMFKNAEDIARGTAWATAKVQWDDATKAFAKAKELGADFNRSSAVFLDISGVNLVKESTQREVMGFLRENRWTEAFDAYAGEVINETMFAYSSGLGPSAYRGVVGRAFGTFGTYPAWYIENFKRGLKYGSLANRVGFVTRFFGNGLSLFAGFTALGISAKDFLPWVPMQFSGGPYYKFANKLLAATGSDYAARQARGELKRELPRLVLPVTQLRNLQDVLNHLDSGNITGAAAALMSVPVISTE